MYKIYRIKYVAIAIFFVLLLSGCSRLEFIDNKLGEMFFSASSTKEKVEPIFVDTKKVDPKNLSKEQKDKINIWLEEQKLNRYGDEPNTYYASGTPLYDKSGEPIERYEYILNNHPDIFNN
jgi:hypothetical protein